MKDWGKTEHIRGDYPNKISKLCPMYSKNTQHKATQGSVQIKISNGRLQLVFSHAGKRDYLSLELLDNKVNRKAAKAKTKMIEQISYTTDSILPWQRISHTQHSLLLISKMRELSKNYTEASICC